MSNHFKAILDKYSEYEYSAEQINDLDILKKPDCDDYHMIYKGKSYNLSLVSYDQDTSTAIVSVNGAEYTIKVEDKWSRLIQEMGLDKQVAQQVAALYAPMPGLVKKVHAMAGTAAKADDTLLVMEAMKMENLLKAPTDVTVSEVHVAEGQVVQKGELLVSFDV